MSGYLIAEEGPVSGLVVRFEEGEEWTLGRDPEEVDVVLEDPMVSRRHAICRKAPEGYLLENLSSVNPATQNGKIIAEPVLLHEGDIIQIGNTFFRFTEIEPREEIPIEVLEAPSLAISSMPTGRWMLKVMAGPNAGAEFTMQKGVTYTIGKDPTSCDILFQDVSVSRQHSRIIVDDHDHIFIEDLGSRNGTVVNGEIITERKELHSQDSVSLGTTSFVMIDREKEHVTVISAPVVKHKEAEAAATPRDWKEMTISKRHLIVALVLALIVVASFVAMTSLFEVQPVVAAEKKEGARIEDIVKKYPDIQFSYNEGSGKLFIIGHVLTAVEKQELMYQIHGLSFLTNIEDNVVIDEYVWQNMNALLMTNSDWLGVSISSTAPGKFVIRGYLQTLEQAQALSDYLNINFPYLDRLDNQVVVESNLMTQVESELLEKGFNNVTYQLTNGELVLSGRVDGADSPKFDGLVKGFKALQGIRAVKNFVIYTTEDSSLVDLSSKYKVMGFSKRDGESHYVVINGKILTLGDTLDGMTLVNIETNMVLLEKDGLKFKINYNLQ
ncbi:MAG: type III secretion system inner membrane ring subunit SctD [Verrucomicrobia bacterium]|nr:type III secretion system inner membrane ring subunit SctD [Verrucomicrobiota bacterium]